jgi:hypothetical protein
VASRIQKSARLEQHQPSLVVFRAQFQSKLVEFPQEKQGVLDYDVASQPRVLLVGDKRMNTLITDKYVQPRSKFFLGLRYHAFLAKIC